ncbi:DNA polymerase III subunit gamma/tau [Gammaproteobacteria bacterium AS21]
MSYQVLARKWRPKQFTEMVGQEHVLKALVNALDDNRLHHAYLFTGTRGVGKTSIARLFAKALNCEQGVSSVPCGQCSACVEISEGRFVDLIEVDAASRTKVEDTRELLENVQYAPSRGRFKVYLIDEVHMLSKSSFNALLKTLEEPPAHVKFLLATTDPQKLPVTVLSRCLQFNLKNMIPLKIVEHLAHVLTQETIAYDESALWLLARSADGSMRDALSLTDQAIAFGAGKVDENDVRVMLGSIDLQLVYKIISALVNRDGVDLLQNVENLAQFSPDYFTVLGDLISLLHRIAIAQTVPAALDNSLGDKQQVIELASLLSAEDVQLFYQIALMGRKDLPYVPDAREGLEMTLMRMLAFRPATSANLEPIPTLSNSVVDADVNVEAGVTGNVAKESLADEVVSRQQQYAEEQKKNEINTDQIATTSDVVADRIDSRVDSRINNNGVDQAVDNSSPVERAKGELNNTALNNEASIAVSGIAVPVTETKPLDVVSDESSLATQAVEQEITAVKDSVSARSQVTDTVQQKPVEIAAPEQQVVVDNDPAPWEDDAQADQLTSSAQDSLREYQSLSNEGAFSEQNSASNSSSLVNDKALVKNNGSAAEIYSATTQINISHMLDAAITDFNDFTLEVWPALVGALGFTGMTAHIAENLSLESIEGNSIHFNVSQVQKNVLDETQKERIQSSLSRYFSQPITVGFDSENSTRETPWQCFEQLRAKRLRQAIDSFQADGVVQQIVAAFSAQIDRSSIMPID